MNPDKLRRKCEDEAKAIVKALNLNEKWVAEQNPEACCVHMIDSVGICGNCRKENNAKNIITEALLQKEMEIESLKLKVAQWEAVDRIGAKKWVDFVTEIKESMEEEIKFLQKDIERLKKRPITFQSDQNGLIQPVVDGESILIREKLAAGREIKSIQEKLRVAKNALEGADWWIGMTDIARAWEESNEGIATKQALSQIGE